MGGEQTPGDTGRAGEASLNESAPTGAAQQDAQSALDTPRNVTPEARRALAEAEERRQKQAQNETRQARELGGRDGPDPVRYGDWEKGGIASDF